MKTMLMFHYPPAPSSNPNLEDHSRSLLSLVQEKLILTYIVLFLKVVKNSLDKRLRILFFFRALCLISTWQATEFEDSQYI